eukprot:gene16284-biopygen18778
MLQAVAAAAATPLLAAKVQASAARRACPGTTAFDADARDRRGGKQTCPELAGTSVTEGNLPSPCRAQWPCVTVLADPLPILQAFFPGWTCRADLFCSGVVVHLFQADQSRAGSGLAGLAEP